MSSVHNKEGPYLTAEELGRLVAAEAPGACPHDIASIILAHRALLAGVQENETTFGKVRELFNSIHRIEPTRENARSILQVYRSQLASDRLIFDALTHGPKRHPDGLNFLVEDMDEEEMLAYMQMPYSATYILPNSEDSSAPPQAFFIAQHANGDAEGFREYIEKKQFPTLRLTFPRGGKSVERELYETALDEGKLLYVAEMVSAESKYASMALLAGLYQKCLQELEDEQGYAFTTVTARCLERGKLGGTPHANQEGNVRIRNMNKAMGLDVLADIDPPFTREILIPRTVAQEHNFHLESILLDRIFHRMLEHALQEHEQKYAGENDSATWISWQVERRRIEMLYRQESKTEFMTEARDRSIISAIRDDDAHMQPDAVVLPAHCTFGMYLGDRDRFVLLLKQVEPIRRLLRSEHTGD